MQPIITRLQALSPASFLLQWDAPAQGVTEFRIYRNDRRIATVSAATREFRDAQLAPATVYAYTVGAIVGGTNANDEADANDQAEILSRPVADVTRLANEAGREMRLSFDVVVAGATPGGIAAALTAARFGRKVALVCPSPWLGGMMTGGLTRTDFGSMKSSGGLFKEFVDRVHRHYVATYGEDAEQVRASRGGYYFEPRVAKWIFHQMLAEQPGVTLLLNHHSRDVVKEGNRVTELFVLDRPRMIRKTLAAKIFIDATYEGDLGAQSGAAYRIGRESREEFDEEHAGELFWEPLQRTVVPGSGRGDRKVQAYNYRLCLTTRADNWYPFPPPAQYDRARYLTLLPDIRSGRVKSMDGVLSILPLPNDKFDANNHPLGNPSSDLIGGSDAYPEADVWQRDAIAEAHRQHILGLLHFVQNDPEVPAAFQQEARRWGFAYDEFADNDRFPTELYVREGRRIIGPYIFTENDARSRSPQRRPNAHYDSIAVADYPIDSHATSPEKNGLLEGFFYLPGAGTQPSQVPYRVMTPLGIEGVLVSVCVSCTHIGYGTLRMEPVFMALGTAAGTAAHLSLASDILPSRLNPADLQRALLAQQHVLCVFNDVPLDHPHWAALQYFGARGFFPGYDARPDVAITRADAARWLWQWMQSHRPDLQPVVTDSARFADVRGDNPAYLAVSSLRHWKVIKVVADGETFGPDEPLTADVADDWLDRATQLLGWRARPVPLRDQATSRAEEAVTRGQFCHRLYGAEPAASPLPKNAGKAP